MTRWEKRVLEFVEKNAVYIFAAAVSALALLVRSYGKDFISGDMKEYLLPWCETFRQGGGLAKLHDQVGNYNVPYQTFLAAISCLDVSHVYLIKGLSILFDFVLAAVCGWLVHDLSERGGKVKAVFTYAAVLGSLNVILNSSVWGQCDSIYISFLILSIIFLRKNIYPVSFLFWGIAFAMKLQAVFLLPLFVIYYLWSKRFSVLYFAVLPAVNLIMCLPAIVRGGSIGRILQIYPKQAEGSSLTYDNYPNFYTLVCSNDAMINRIAVILTVLVIGSMLVWILNSKASLDKGSRLVMLSLWGAWSMVLFLPGMHDRYAYLADILSILLAVLYKRYWWTAAGCNLISLFVYCNYLFDWLPFDMRILGLLNVLLYILYTMKFCESLRE